MERVHGWCEEFGTIARELKIEKPAGFNLLSLSQDGKIIGLDGHPMPNGHVDAFWKGGLLPFPDNCLSVTLSPIEEIRELSQRYHNVQDAFLQAMILSPGVKDTMAALGAKDRDLSDLEAVKCMRRGAANIAGWFRDDCHRKMLTCFLPPTASMPDAVYSPNEIYKLK